MTSWWRHFILASKGCWKVLSQWIQKKKMKKCRCVCQICSNECGFSKISWRHKYSWDDVTVTWGQFLDTPFPNLDTKLKSIGHVLLLLLPFENCHFKALSRDPWWRHENFKGDVQKITVRSTYMYVYGNYHQNQGLFNGNGALHTNTVLYLWDFFRQKKTKKKIQNKSNSFSASPKRAEKPIR